MTSANKDQYESGRHSFIPGLLPEKAVQLSTQETLQILAKRLGVSVLRQALDYHQTILSPVSQELTGLWLQKTNIVGVNVRTIHHFWNVVKYAFTLPAHQDAVHLLPIWEPGVVASLYGMTSWQINPEFFSKDLAIAFPGLNTVEKQLKVVVNLLHAMGKNVGMDVIPHTDRYSEIVLANPHYFEWLQRRDFQIIDHSANLHLKVEAFIFQFLCARGSATGSGEIPENSTVFFSEAFSEEQRLRLLFGAPDDYEGRLTRRDNLIQALYEAGFETVPATMAPPYRGLKVDPNEQNAIVDKRGRVWRDYLITAPQEMSRVFGPLTRYKLYERLDNNKNWAIDFSRPRPSVWNYVCRRYAEVQTQYNLDFMRGDMSHVQMRPEGAPLFYDEYYDLLQAVKNYIRRQAPYFAYYAESFLAPPNYMAYGDEIDHLEASEAEVALGDLQSMTVGSPRFMQNFRRYLDIATYRKIVPCFTIMTSDKDDPRFDEFYLSGNEIRLFIGLFLTDLPSYMGLGFECRDVHIQPAPNENYTKLYVFQIDQGPKATRGPYIWGQNKTLFERLNHVRLHAEDILPLIRPQKTRWLLPPDPSGGQSVIAWTQDEQAQFIFIANLNTERDSRNIKIPWPQSSIAPREAHFRFSTHSVEKKEGRLIFSDLSWRLDVLKAGEGLCFQLTAL